MKTLRFILLFLGLISPVLAQSMYHNVGTYIGNYVKYYYPNQSNVNGLAATLNRMGPMEVININGNLVQGANMNGTQSGTLSITRANEGDWDFKGELSLEGPKIEVGYKDGSGNTIEGVTNVSITWRSQIDNAEPNSVYLYFDITIATPDGQTFKRTDNPIGLGTPQMLRNNQFNDPKWSPSWDNPISNPNDAPPSPVPTVAYNPVTPGDVGGDVVVTTLGPTFGSEAWGAFFYWQDFAWDFIQNIYNPWGWMDGRIERDLLRMGMGPPRNQHIRNDD